MAHDAGASTAVKTEQGKIHYKDVDSFDRASYGKIIHYKGFGRLVDFDDEATTKFAGVAVEYIASLRPDTIVWDGDSYASDSFTHLIPELLQRTGARLVMFLKNAEKARSRVERTWLPVGLDLECFLCATDISHDKLGEKALQSTQSREIVCFGGGPVVEAEFKLAPEDIIFHLVPAQRRSKDGSGTERCALEGLTAPNLKLVTSPP